jgi:hypothetical protein
VTELGSSLEGFERLRSTCRIWTGKLIRWVDRGQGTGDIKKGIYTLTRTDRLCEHIIGTSFSMTALSRRRRPDGVTFVLQKRSRGQAMSVIHWLA